MELDTGVISSSCASEKSVVIIGWHNLEPRKSGCGVCARAPFKSTRSASLSIPRLNFSICGELASCLSLSLILCTFFSNKHYVIMTKKRFRGEIQDLYAWNDNHAAREWLIPVSELVYQTPVAFVRPTFGCHMLSGGLALLSLDLPFDNTFCRLLIK